MLAGEMADPHGRFEQLAVGHVLGGLGSSDAADFRSHLLGCEPCRTRVAELRAIAEDLEAAELDERQRSRVQTVAPRRAEATTQGAEAPGGITIRHVTVAVIAVLLLAGAMAFWNLHLRTTVAFQSSVVEGQEDVLRVLATGVAIPTTMADGLRGQVARDDDQVAVSLSGVDDVEPGQSIVGWLLDAEGRPTADSALLARSGPLDDGLLIGALTVGEAVEILVTREAGELGAAPQGEMLVQADLGGAG